MGTDLAARIDRFADAHQSYGDMRDPAWRQGLHRVLRHRFVPSAARAVPDYPGRSPYPIGRARSDAEWMHAIYSDTCVITQIDDGDGDPATGNGAVFWSRWPRGPVTVSWRSGRGPVGRPGILAWRCGPENTVTIEVAPDVAARVCVNLAHLNTQRRVYVGDGRGCRGCTGMATVRPGPCQLCGELHLDAVGAADPVWRDPLVPYQPGFAGGIGQRLTVAEEDCAVGLRARPLPRWRQCASDACPPLPGRGRYRGLAASRRRCGSAT